MVEKKSLYVRLKPLLGVILLQFCYAGMDVLSKVAINKGMSIYVLIVYCHAIATFVIAPFAIVLDKRVRPKMTLPIFTKILALGMLGPVIGHDLYFMGMKYTNATFAAALANTIPVITFIIAYICRLEKLKFSSMRSQAKIFGTITTVAGAMIMTLVKGPILEIGRTRGINVGPTKGGEGAEDPIKGAVMIVAGCFSMSCSMILQAITMKTYPVELSLTVWICLLGSIEGTVVAFAMERGNLAVWAINWDTKLLTMLYGGIIYSGLAYYIQGVVVKERGPVFVTAFNPLATVIVAIMGFFILSEQLFLGRLLGAIVIVLGLYLVVWGKAKDHVDESPPPSQQSPISEK